MQALCNHSKVTREKMLAKEVPQIKRLLEVLYRTLEVRHMMI